MMSSSSELSTGANTLEQQFVELGALKLVGLPYAGSPEGGMLADPWRRLMQQVLPTQGRVG